MLARSLEPKRTVEVPLVTMIVGFASLALINIASIWGLVILSNGQADENDRQQKFREQLSCFVIGITQAKPGADLLQSCDFLVIGE